uniref:Uncharacterized protein n=1 Tax=Arundo donax TaxID=35708 RepID=A0A0A8ZJD7_ARUDO
MNGLFCQQAIGTWEE